MSITKQQKEHCVAMFPWLPFGHVNPFIQLSNQLAQHGFTISFLATRDCLPKIKPFVRFPEKIHMIPLDVNIIESTEREIQNPLHKLLVATDSLKDQVERELALLKPDIVIYEFAQYVPSIAHELGIKPVFYCVTSATSVAYHLVPACSPGGQIPSSEDLTHPPQGYPTKTITLQPFEARQLLFAFNRYGDDLSLHERIVVCMQGADLIIMKTSPEMEKKYCEYIHEQYGKPMILAGLSLPEQQSDPLDEKWDTWLRRFPLGSVIYCSFGSEDVLSKEQLQELLLGLEQSGVPFLAVLKFPEGATQDEVLPEGFVDRVKDRGLIHSGWVQQQLILNHKSVGGYLCHSGFGSLAEAISGGCQLVLLPQKGDQFFNARLMSKDLKVAVEVERHAEDGKFTKEDVCRAVRSVMVEGDLVVTREVRNNHAKLKEMLLNKDVQSRYMDQVVAKLKQFQKRCSFFSFLRFGDPKQPRSLSKKKKS